MPARRYKQFCGVARALDVLGERWSLLIVRDLLTGPQRYSDLLHTLGGIPTDILANRLRHLEAAGLVRRATLPPPAGSKVYELTDRGQQLEPVVAALARWGTDLLDEPAPDDIFRLEWLALAMRSRFRPERAEDVELTVNIEIDGETLRAEIADRTLTTHPEPAESPDVHLAGDPAALAAAARGQRLPGRLHVTGAPDAVAQLGRAFGLPE